MNEITKKKLNLLVHLAKIDGRFHATEKQVLQDMLKESKISGFDSMSRQSIDLEEFKSVREKDEILYWAIKMIMADDIITKEEINYCKDLAEKLGYKSSLIDFFVKRKEVTMVEFKEQSARWMN